MEYNSKDAEEETEDEEEGLKEAEGEEQEKEEGREMKKEAETTLGFRELKPFA